VREVAPLAQWRRDAPAEGVFLDNAPARFYLRGMSRRSQLALALSACIGVLILIGGLTPSSLGQGPVRRDGPILHALSFGLLVLPLVAIRPRQWWLIVIVASLFGLAIEGLQTYTNRATELSDIVANSVGAMIGALLGWAVAWVWRRRARGMGLHRNPPDA
jgi:VanZ family protein